MQKVSDIRAVLGENYLNEDFVIDKTGVKCVEIIGAQFVADEVSIFGEVNEDYVRRELEWYMSGSLNVNDIPEPVPAIWKRVATPDGRINSNYGWAIYSRENHLQFSRVVIELQGNKDSRRGQMIYTRPTMHTDCSVDGMSDFMCTTAVQYLIRDNKLISYVTMRSNDAWAGYRNDYAWQLDVQKRVAEALQIECGDIIWNVASLHVYESQFYLLDHYIRTGKSHITKKEYDELYK